MAVESMITHGPGGTMVTGQDGMRFVRAVTLWTSLECYVSSKGKIIPTRGMTITRMLAIATEFTGKKYKRSEAKQAAADVKVWADEMRAALPEEHR